MAFFAKNPKGWSVGSTNKRTTISFSLPAAAIAAFEKPREAEKYKNEKEKQTHTKKYRTNYHYAEKFPP